MRLYFYHRNGQPEMDRQYYAPGKFVIDQNMTFGEREYTEGERARFHVGHGCYHDYVVMSADKDTALLQRV